MVSKVLWHSFVTTPAFLGLSLLAAGSVGAVQPPTEASPLDQVRAYTTDTLPTSTATAEVKPATDTASLQQVRGYSNSGESGQIGQVTSVTQLSDVKPTDWAFSALQSLVEKYGCIVGYPDRTFRGSRAMTRYEAAAALNACMDRISELLAQGLAEKVNKEDLAAVIKLQEEFREELDQLKGKVDSLEVRASRLERQQFSTTTKLTGEVLFTLAGINTDNGTVLANGSTAPTAATTPVGDSIILAQRTRLTLTTSFVGTDLLRVRLDAGNIPNFSGATISNTNQARLGFDSVTGTTTTPAFNLGVLTYRFQAFDKGRFDITAIGAGPDDDLGKLVPLSSNAALSRFGAYNPIYRTIGPVAGASFNYPFTEWFNLGVGYYSADPANAADGSGVDGSTRSIYGQITVKPLDNFTFAFVYANAFSKTGGGFTGGTSSAFADAPLLTSATATASDAFANWAESNEYSLQFSFRPLPKFVTGGWIGFKDVTRVNVADSTAELINWAVQLGFPDVIRPGDMGGIIVGQPYQITSTTATTRADGAGAVHIEGFYRLALTPNVSVTPGIIYILDANNNPNNPDLIIGAIRTRFAF